MSLTNHQEITFVCDVCGAAHHAGGAIPQGASARVPEVPEGWTQLGRLVFCPEHDVTVIAGGRHFIIHQFPR